MTDVLWRTLKGFVYSGGFVSFGYYAVENGAPVFPTTIAVFVAVYAAMARDLREVDIANVVTLTFDRNRKRPPPGRGSG